MQLRRCTGTAARPQVRADSGAGGGGGGGGGFSLHIDKPEQMQRPGLAADFAFCRGIRKVRVGGAGWQLGGQKGPGRYGKTQNTKPVERGWRPEAVFTPCALLS